MAINERGEFIRERTVEEEAPPSQPRASAPPMSPVRPSSPLSPPPSSGASRRNFAIVAIISLFVVGGLTLLKLESPVPQVPHRAIPEFQVTVPTTFLHDPVATQLLNAGYTSNCSREYPGFGFNDIVTISKGQWDNGQQDVSKHAYFGVYENKVIFGELTGDGRREAVVHTACGVEASTEAYSEVFVIDTSTPNFRVLARLSPHDWADEALGIAWNVSTVAASHGALRIRYSLGGSHAQPNWNAIAVFRWNGTGFLRTGLLRTPIRSAEDKSATSSGNLPTNPEGSTQSKGLGENPLAPGQPAAPATGFLKLVSQPESGVSIDGTPEGATDSSGTFFTKLPAGKHQVTVTKDHYQPGSYSIDVTPGTIAEFRAPLMAIGGFLSIATNISDASIVVSGLGNFTGSLSHVACPVGTYDIQVFRTGAQTVTRTISVSAGEDAAVQIHLDPSPGYLHSTMMMAQTALGHGDVSDATRDAEAILSLDRTNGAAWGILASADSQLGNWSRFRGDARAALSYGGIIVFRMMREHNRHGWTGEVIHPIQMTITATMLQIDSLGLGDDLGHISAPLSTIGTIEITDKTVDGGNKFIGVVVRHLLPGTYLLHLDVQRGRSPQDRMQLYLATGDATVVRESNGVNYLSEPVTSRETLAAIAEVIGIAVARTHGTGGTQPPNGIPPP